MSKIAPDIPSHTRAADLLGVVLAGGRSARMGRDKAAIKLRGQTLLTRAVELLTAVLTDVCVVGRAHDVHSDRLQVASHPDDAPGLGPIGGIATALRLADPRGCLVIACDMPVLEPRLLAELMACRAPAADCTVVRHAAGRQKEPLLAIYEQSCRLHIERFIKAGNLKMHDLLESCKVAWFDLPPTMVEQVRNVNRPEDLDCLI